MRDMHVLHLVSMSFLTSDQKVSLLSPNISFQLKWPKRNASTTWFCSSSPIINMSPANGNPKRSINSIKAGRLFRSRFPQFSRDKSSTVMILDQRKFYGSVSLIGPGKLCRFFSDFFCLDVPNL